MYRKPCIDVTQFCNDLCIGHNVAMIRNTFFGLKSDEKNMRNFLLIFYLQTLISFFFQIKDKINFH